MDELLKKLDTLPSGYISKKTIKGKEYTYLQYFEKGKLVSKYIPAKKVKFIEKKLALRKELEKEVEELSDGYIPMVPVTKRELELTGYIMCGDKIAAKIYKGEVVSFDEKIAPFYLQRNKDAKAYFASRCVDLSRNNARALLRSLNIKDNDDSIIPLYVNGCSLTDNVWFKPSGAVTKYEELKFGKNLYGDASLNGNKKSYPFGACRTPEIVTPGRFEKCWKFENNHWYLYKKENRDEMFSSLFAMELAKVIGVNTVKYEKVDDCLKCKNFAEEYNFDPIGGLVENVDDLVGTYNELKKLNKDVLKDYLKIRYLDALTYNVDRTGNDMGVLRDRDSGEVISLAPNFDNNYSLVSMLPKLDLPANKDPMVLAFVDFIRSDKETKTLFKKCKFPKLKKDTIKKIVLKVDETREDIKDIIDFVYSRFVYIKKHCK